MHPWDLSTRNQPVRRSRDPGSCLAYPGLPRARSEQVNRLTQEFLEAVPDTLRNAVEELLDQPQVSIVGLRRQVTEHTRSFEGPSESGEALDVELAQTIEHRCLDLLLEAERSDDLELRSLVQVVCEYYVFDADVEGDFDSVAGLDDDAEVINALLFALGRDDDTIHIG